LIFARYIVTELQFGATPSKEMLGYCDVDWGGDLEDRRSTTWFFS